MTPVQELDSLNCPLRGLFLIEAAAGTGKTYNIQNLVVRAVLERDIPIEKLLVVTYTRAAAAELAGRIRQVLSGTLAALEKRLPPESGREAQLVARALKTLTSGECRKRLRTALFDFDAATVTTIHGFCQKVLRENAFESGILFSRELDNDCAELLEKLADDLYRREFYPDDDAR
ncbi:MAG: UvrD-helicase domain-containing protein, partial [Victivallis vadensis]